MADLPQPSGGVSWLRVLVEGSVAGPRPELSCVWSRGPGNVALLLAGALLLPVLLGRSGPGCVYPGPAGLVLLSSPCLARNGSALTSDGWPVLAIS